MIHLQKQSLKAKFIEYSHYVLQNDDGSTGYLITEETKKSMKQVFEVFENKSYGIMLYGNPGVGKTIVFDILKRILHPKDDRQFIKINTLDLVADFSLVGDKVYRYHNDKHVFFDDFGAEDKGQFYNHKNIEVFEKVIQFRYDFLRSSGIRTFFTTNLSPQEIKDRYGIRCHSRLKEMCEHIVIDGNDMRPRRNFKGYPTVYHERIRTQEDIDWENQYAAMRERDKINPPVAPVHEGIGTKWKKSLNRLATQVFKG